MGGVLLSVIQNSYRSEMVYTAIQRLSGVMK